jgi:hypothetical protein
MAFGLRLPGLDLPALEDDLRTSLDGLRQDATRALDRLDPPGLEDRARDAFDRGDAASVFDGSLIRDLLARNGLDQGVDIRTLNDLADVADRLPGGLGGPDSTGEVPTGSAAIGRETALQATLLAASPRIVEALGDGARSVEIHGQSYQVAETYRDPETGFSALRLTAPDGSEVFAVDGLEVGSRPDEVAAVTLGRLQVESAEFREMVQDAAAYAVAGDPVLITGPSLGGAVAEVAACETAEAVLAATRGAAAAPIRLVTVDGLGGRDAAEAINGGHLDGRALELITALNLRTDGDLVSRIGSHIGATLTLPALDAQGRLVELDPAEAHVNAVSLLQVLESDALFARGVAGPPAEISGFAAIADPAAEGVIAAWRAADQPGEEVPPELQFPGAASFDATGTVWSVDADENGTVDIAVRLAAPVDAATADRVLG